MTRAVHLAILALAASCSSQAPQSCPGQPVGRFTFEAALATTTLAAGLDPGPALPECAAALGFPPALAPFSGTIAADPETSAGALCRSTGLVLFGTHSGQRWTVEASSGGAVLAACGPTCGASSRVVISGDVLPDVTSPTGFQGALVEQLTASEGSCDECVLPCAVRYELSGTSELP